ncbi:MAG TPA: Rv3235 family protein [Actinomycetes bacterium]|nr:Rv3235 family protein [Actinomycetes bacterium]
MATQTDGVAVRSEPPLYVMRAPQTDPPYDTEEWRPELVRTELGIGVPIQGTLALNFAPSRPLPPARTDRQLRLVTDPADGESSQPARTPRSQLPDPRELGFRLAVAVGEALAGARPADHLARSFSETAFGAVLAAVPARRRAVRRVAGSPARSRIKVRSIHSFEPADGAAEVSAHVHVGDRGRAVALRLEGLAGRWICTQVQVG